MKKIIARLMAAALVFTATSLFIGCGETKPEPKKEMTPAKDAKKDEKK